MLASEDRSKGQELPQRNREFLQERGCRNGVAQPRLATTICQLRHDRMEQGPTEPHAGRSTFLLSSGGAGGRVLLSGR